MGSEKRFWRSPMPSKAGSVIRSERSWAHTRKKVDPGVYSHRRTTLLLSDRTRKSGL